MFPFAGAITASARSIIIETLCFIKGSILKQDAKELSRKLSKMFVTGNVLFPQLTAEQNAKAKFPSDKPTMTVVFPKGEGDHDDIANEINALHASVGGNSDIVRDGDSEELKKYNADCWVMRVRFGPRAKVVDTKKQSIPIEQIEMRDRIRLAVSLFDYSDRTKKGISVYISWVMLLEKGGLDAIPDFEGGDGFVAGSAVPAAANGHAVDIDDEDDDQGDDQDDPTVETRMPESMMALLNRQRSKSAGR